MTDPLDEVFETPEESLARYLNEMPKSLWSVFENNFMRRPTTGAVDLPSAECPKCHNFGGTHFSLCPLANSANH